MRGAITLNSTNLTINATNASGWRIEGGVTGTGNLTFQANGSGGIDLFVTNALGGSTTINNSGTVTNSGSGSGSLNTAGTLGTNPYFGANVTSLIESSSTSAFNLSNNNSSFVGTAQVLLGTMILSSSTALNSANQVFVASGATLDVQQNNTIAGLSNVSGSGGTVTNGSTPAGTDTLTVGGNGNYTFSGALTDGGTGTLAFTKTGTGTLTLGGGAADTAGNTYTGLTTVNSGQLLLNKADGTNAIASNVLLGGNDKTDDLVINGGTVKLNRNNQIINSASVRVNAGGTLLLNGKNETIYNFYNAGVFNTGRGGTFIVTDPTWATGSTNDIYNNTSYANLTIEAGTTNTVHGDEGSGFGSASLTIGAGGLTFSQAGSTNLTVSSDNVAPGILALSGNVSFTGATGTASITNGNRLIDDGFGGSTDSSTLGSIAGRVDLNGATRTFTVTNAPAGLNVSAQIVGSGTNGISKEGAGTMTLTASNTYTGTTTISAGTLQVGNGGTTGTLGTGAVTDNALLVFNRSDSATVGNTISGSGSVTQAGSGTTILSASNSYSGTTNINSGTLAAGNDAAMGTSVVNFGGGAIAADGGAHTLSNLLSTAAADGKVSGSNDLTLNGVISGGNGMVINNSATTIFGATNNSYAGVTTINSGILSVSYLANGGQLSSIGSSSNAASNLVIGNNATLRYTGNGMTTDRLLTIGTGGATFDASGVGAINFSNPGGVAYAGVGGPRTVTLTGAYVDMVNPNTFGLGIGDGPGGATNLVKTGVGTWVVSGSNSYSGGTTLSNGNLAVMGDNALGTATVNFAGGSISSIGSSTLSNLISTTAAGGVVNGSGNLRFNGAISGSNGMVINNTGITTYGASNSYSGSTTINSGATLRTEAAGALSNTSSIAVISGTLIDAASGSIGTLANSGSAPGMTLNNGTLTVVDTGGAVTDYIGALTLVGNSTINLTANANNSEFHFLSITTGVALTINNWLGTGGTSGTGDKIFVGNSITYSDAQLAQISFTGFGTGAMQIGFGEIVPLSAVPEPSTIVGALLLAGFVGYRERRRVRGLLGCLTGR